jgi:hypothetical protein
MKIEVDDFVVSEAASQYLDQQLGREGTKAGPLLIESFRPVVEWLAAYWSDSTDEDKDDIAELRERITNLEKSLQLTCDRIDDRIAFEDTQFETIEQNFLNHDLHLEVLYRNMGAEFPDDQRVSTVVARQALKNQKADAEESPFIAWTWNPRTGEERDIPDPRELEELREFKRKVLAAYTPTPEDTAAQATVIATTGEAFDTTAPIDADERGFLKDAAFTAAKERYGYDLAAAAFPPAGWEAIAVAVYNAAIPNYVRRIAELEAAAWGGEESDGSN